MKRFVLISLFALQALAAAPDIPIGFPPRYEADPDGPMFRATIAGNGSGFLAVWQTSIGNKLAAARISGNGELLDPHGFVIAQIGANTQSFKAAWNGSAYVVVWENANRIFVARVSSDGQVLEQPRVIANGVFPSQIAANGSRLAVLFQEDYGGAGRVLLLDAGANAVSELKLPAFLPRLIARGDGFDAIGSLDIIGKVIRVEHFDVAGRATQRLDIPRTAGFHENGPCATDGENLFIMTDGGKTALLVAGDLSRVLRTTPIDPQRYASQVVWTGEQYVLIDGGRLTRFARDGSLLNDTPPVLPAHILTAAASNGDRLAQLSYGGNVPGVTSTASPLMVNIVSARTGAELSPARPVTSRAARQRGIQVVFGGGVALVTWGESSGAYAVRMTPDGRSLDGAGLSLGVASSSRPIFDGTNFVLVSTNDTDVTVRFISPAEGLLRDELTLGKASSQNYQLQRNPFVSRAAGGTLVAWVGEDNRVWTARVDAATRLPATPPLPLSPPTNYTVVNPAVAWNGSEYLVTWDEGTLHPIHSWYEPRWTRAMRASAELLPRDTEPLRFAAQPVVPPRIASNGRDWLVVRSPNQGAPTIQRLFADGTASEPVSLPWFDAVAGLEWNGIEYILAVRTALDLELDAYLSSSVRFMRIAATGPIDQKQFALLPTPPSSEVEMALDVPTGRYALLYTRVTAEEPYGISMRTFLRMEVLSPPKRRAVR